MAGIGAKLAGRKRIGDRAKQLRTKDVGAERRQALGFVRRQLLFVDIEVQRDDLKVAVVGQRDLHRIVDRQHVRLVSFVLRTQRQREGKRREQKPERYGG